VGLIHPLISLETKKNKNKMKLFKSKKGLALGDMYPAVIAIVLVGVLIGIGMYMMGNIATQVGVRQCTQPANYHWNATAGVCHNLTNVSNTSVAGWNPAYIATNTTIGGIAGFPTWIPIIVTVIAAAIILGLVLNTLGGSRRQ